MFLAVNQFLSKNWSSGHLVDIPVSECPKTTFGCKNLLKNSIAFPSKTLEVPNGFKRCFYFRLGKYIEVLDSRVASFLFSCLILYASILSLYMWSRCLLVGVKG